MVLDVFPSLPCELRIFLKECSSFPYFSIQSFWGEETVSFPLEVIYLKDNGFFVQNVRVFDRWKRRGVGRALMLRVQDEMLFRGVPYADLQVAPDNFPAIRLYESLGWRFVGREHFIGGWISLPMLRYRLNLLSGGA